VFPTSARTGRYVEFLNSFWDDYKYLCSLFLGHIFVDVGIAEFNYPNARKKEIRREYYRFKNRDAQNKSFTKKVPSFTFDVNFVFSNRAHPLTTITRYFLCVPWVLLELPGHWSCGLSFSSESPQIITCPARCLDPWLKCVRRPGARMHPLEMTPADGDWQEGHKHKVLRAPEALLPCVL
jgi:hypothetical protein